MVIWIKILSFNLKAFAALVNVSNHIFIGGFAVVGDAVGVVNSFIKANSVIDIVGVAANVVIDTADQVVNSTSSMNSMNAASSINTAILITTAIMAFDHSYKVNTSSFADYLNFTDSNQAIAGLSMKAVAIGSYSK